MRIIALVLLVGCTGHDPYVVVERQSAPLAQARMDGWSLGGALIVGTPGTLTFPQPLSLRISLVDPAGDPDEAGALPPLTISSASVDAYGSAPFQVTAPPTCQQTYCTAELSITAAGANMIAVRATGADGTFAECLYYAQYEDANPSSVTDTRREELEAQQRECQGRTN